MSKFNITYNNKLTSVLDLKTKSLIREIEQNSNSEFSTTDTLSDFKRIFESRISDITTGNNQRAQFVFKAEMISEILIISKLTSEGNFKYNVCEITMNKIVTQF